jgi:hypothetical protein
MQARSASEEGFDPERSCLNTDTVAAFVDAPVQADITSVPGIGPASAALLAAGDEVGERVQTTLQLLGKFLSFFAEGVDAQEACDAMWYWLQNKGVAGGHRAGIVLCLAEKLNRMIPGVCDLQDIDEVAD